MAHYDLHKLLAFTVKQKASDLILKAGSPPILRINGDLVRMKSEPLEAEDTREISYQILTEDQQRRFEDQLELDLGYQIEGLARFRINLMVQRGRVTTTARVIPFEIKRMEELGVPETVRRMCDYPRGLVLVTGPTGSGKSTTQAAMIDYVNETRPVHIVTVEDPIEFVHEDKMALINQRELGEDTLSFADALKYVLRQDPDVILIGEMRDLETIGLAITAAETGHLVFGTLHTVDAVQTVDRVIDVFPPHQQQQVRMQLSVNLVGVVSQTLVKTADLQGRVAAFEVMEAIPAIRNLIREAKTHQVRSVIQTGSKRGMMVLDQHLAQLVVDGVADYFSAREKAVNIEEFDDMVRAKKPELVEGAAEEAARRAAAKEDEEASETPAAGS
ncbi:MAG: type IV pilus twitching motility protein PilT [Armatimonadetes bacterium]|nr:type IV pilus twitching motility protein PilT [Armatimonadota bacterium]